jgi:hypothetical protein
VDQAFSGANALWAIRDATRLGLKTAVICVLVGVASSELPKDNLCPASAGLFLWPTREAVTAAFAKSSRREVKRARKSAPRAFAKQLRQLLFFGQTCAFVNRLSDKRALPSAR